MSAESSVADIGSGTGIFTQLLLDAGCVVLAVEPNAAMRDAAEEHLGPEPRFRSINGTAEHTGLESARVDLITATQAFHWFDQEAAKLEFRRILRPGGWIAVTWNERLKDVDGFHAGYEQIVRKWGTDYSQVDHARFGTAEMNRFFAPKPCHVREFENSQLLDWEGLRNRLLSSSFAPNINSPNCAPMLAELDALFRTCARDGRIAMLYRTLVFYGQSGSAVA